MSDQLYLRNRGRVAGPFSLEKLQTLARRGQISRLHEISEDGVSWISAGSRSEIFDFVRTSGQQENGSQNSPVGAATVSGASAPPVEGQWYYSVAGTRAGPVGTEVIQAMIAGGRIEATDYLWRPGMESWISVSESENFSSLLPSASEKPADAPVRDASSDRPAGEIAEAVRRADRSQQLVLTPQAVYSMTTSRGWVLFIAVFLYAWCILASAFWFVVLVLGLQTMPMGGPLLAAVVSAIPGIVSTLVSAILLNRYYIAVARFSSTRSVRALVQAFDRLKLFWVYVSILLLIGLLLFSVAILVVLIADEPMMDVF